MPVVHSIIAVLAAFAVSGCVSTGNVKAFKDDQIAMKEEAEISMAERHDLFRKRRFTYLMAWNGIPVGKIIAVIGDVVEYKGRDVHVVTIKTESNKYLSKIYRVEDIYTSYVDAETVTSRRYEADRKEGNYRKHLVVEYDFDRMKAVYTNLTDGSVKECAIRENVQDPVSAMCYFMTLPISVGDRLNITVNLNEKNYDLYGKVEKLDMIDLPDLGTFPAFRIRPYAEVGGKKYKRGSGYLYFTSDKERRPIYGVVWIPFGKVTATLRSVEEI